MLGKVLVFSLAASVVGLPAAPPSDATAPPSISASRRAQALPLEVDYARSTLVAKVKKGGLLRFLGHEHGVMSDAWSAEVRFDLQDLEGSSIVVEVDAAALIVDTAPARRLAGIDPDGPNEEEVEEIQAKMLSDEQLGAETFPTIRFESSTLRLRADDRLRIEGTLTLHGVARPIEVDAELAPDGPEGSGYVVRGGFKIKQKDFGIQPVSIGGVVKVANELEISFEIFASRPAGPDSSEAAY